MTNELCNSAKLENACKEAAASLGISTIDFATLVHDAWQEICDKTDIASWLEDEDDITYDNDLVNEIYEYFVAHYNADMTHWQNIAQAYEKVMESKNNQTQT